MSLVTVSEKRNRVYKRKFDHDEARQLRDGGLTYEALAERMGVTITAVRRVCDPLARQKIDAHAAIWQRENRPQCRGGCGRAVSRYQGSGYCRSCRNVITAAPDVRADELRCTKCGDWKPDSEFRLLQAPPRWVRRGRNSWCKRCETAARLAWRQRNLERERATDRRRRSAARSKLKMAA